MNIDNLIEKLINLKSNGVEEIEVIDDNWNDFEMDIAGPQEVGEETTHVGYFIVYPSHAPVED